MTGRASVHTENATEQFLHRTRILILVHTIPEQFSKRNEAEQKPIWYSVNIALYFLECGKTIPSV